MVDPATLALLGPAYLIGKILGPTAEYLGEGVREWTERRTENVKRVFARAGEKLGDELETPGTVAPRVLRAVLEEAQFAEDEMLTEYLAGVLASARTTDARDDRGVALASLIGRLSSYQIRGHYLLYRGTHEWFSGAHVDLASFSLESSLFVPLDEWVSAMDLSEEEREGASAFAMHVLYGLERESLVASAAAGLPELLRLRVGRAYTIFPTQGGMVFKATPLGIELFTWAHGRRGEPYKAFASLEPRAALPLAPCRVRPVYELPDTTWSSGLYDMDV